MVGSRYRWHFSNTFYNIFGQTSHLDHLCTFLEFFSGISHMPTFSHSSWWLTALRTAKTTRRRRPAKLLKSYHFGWNFFSNWDVIYCSGFGCHNFFLTGNMSDNVHVSWWTTTLWTARTTWRRRPARSLTLGGITSVGIIFNQEVICSGDTA